MERELNRMIGYNLRYDVVSSYVEKIQSQINATAAATYIIQDDAVVHEWYSGKQGSSIGSRKVDEKTQFNVGSVRKTYLALAISLLMEKGVIKHIDDEVSIYLNEWEQDLHGITIRHLLTHTHGLVHDGGKRVKSFAAGQSWAYTNAGISILLELVSCLSGKNLSEFMQDEVFNPLGFVETGWRTEPHEYRIYNYYEDRDNWVGPNEDASGDQSNLFVSARELALWGKLHLNKGNIQGRQVIAETVFERITTLQTPSMLPALLPKQGFIWWLQSQAPHNQIGECVPQGSYQVLGITGCACLVIPEHRIVAVRMYNQLSNPAGYDYLADIREFGNQVVQACISS
jgi:CubicO group peptidase (beta-lactamase class C family)